MNCKQCNTPFIIKSKQQKFCSRSCAATFNNTGRVYTEATRHKIRSSIKKYKIDNSIVHDYICAKCGIEFNRTKQIPKGRNHHCDTCKRKTVKVDLNSITSILQTSTRTASKIIKRAGISCSLCGWDKASLDIHHIIPKGKGGLDDHNNLIAICPNCHRMAHNELYTTEQLMKHNLEIVFTNWKDFYNG